MRMNLPLLLLCAVPLLRACDSQTYHAGYPFGPETSWTRYTWPSLKVRFPHEQILNWNERQQHGLYSSQGPHSLAQYKREAEEQAKRSPGYSGDLASDEAIARCTTCNVLQTVVWEEARQLLHATGKLPGTEQLVQMLSKSCHEQTPEIMQTLSKLSAKLQVTGGRAQMPADIGTAKAEDFCKELLEVLVEGNPKSVVTALSHGLRHYTSRVNSENVLEEVGGQGGLKSFDRIPVPGSCEDFHSECQKWALADECFRNPNYMVGNGQALLGHCNASCGTCLSKLGSGDLPQATSHVSLSAEMLHEAQFMACNASGICAGVDASAMPKITAISVGPDGSVQSVRDILSGLASKEQPAVLSPSARSQQGPEALQELKRAAEGLPSTECFEMNMGWWTYELCPGLHLRQFHRDLNSGKEQIIHLGFYKADAQPQQTENQVLEAATSVKGAHTFPRYFASFLYTEGSKCLLQGQGIEVEREAEVRMACSLDGKTYLSVREPSTCKYVVLLRTPDLCVETSREPRLREPKAIPNSDRDEL